MEIDIHSTSWMEGCLAPLQESPCGIDPLYHDQFERVKLEIEKLGGGDYECVIQSSTGLTMTTSKDLRVVGYLCLALAWKEQAKGLIRGLELYTHLINLYAETIHPKSAKAKQSALAWLNNPRLPGLLGKAETLSQDTHKQLKATITNLNKLIKQHLGESFQAFNVLDQWLSEAPTTKPSPSIGASEKKELAAPALVEEINNDKDAQALQNRLITYWLNEEEWLQACQLSRSLRWSNLSPPTENKQQTRIPAPRKEALESLEKAIEQADAPPIIRHCETLFLEPGGQFYLDLQYRVWDAAHRMQHYALADYIQQQTRWLCKRFPQLKTLRFANGLAFLHPDRLQWLDEPEAATSVKNTLTVEDFLRGVQAPLKAKNLNVALEQLRAAATASPLEGLRRLQAMAKASVSEKRYDFAMIYYQELLSKAEREQLNLWHPEEALSVWNEILSFAESKAAHGLSGEELSPLIYRLKRHICL